ncbi:MAG TPA: hypothetical protein VJR89_00515 [Polyangiales bacterium]|nr:hypothetical protein [Polyangiales bacterium]
MEDERNQSSTLEWHEPRRKHYLSGRPVHSGDLIEVCFSSGWLPMRYEWNDSQIAPHFHFTVELGGGRVWQSFLELPDDVLLRWPAVR